MWSLLLLEETSLCVMLAVTHSINMHTYYILSVLFVPLGPQSHVCLLYNFVVNTVYNNV